MSRFIPLVVLLLVSNSVCGAEPQFKNERAQKAEEAYQAKLKAARESYIKELDVAIKEAGGAGELDEANKMAELKQSLEEAGESEDRDELAPFRRKLENTRWGDPTNPGGFLRLLTKGKTRNHKNYSGVWVVTDEHTALTQSNHSANIYVFKFDEEMNTAKVYTFEQSKDAKPRTFRKR